MEEITIIQYIQQNRNRAYSLLLTILVCLFSSCQHEPYNVYATEKNSVTLYINLPSGQTRAITNDDENKITEIDVLLFNTSDGKYVETISGTDIADVTAGVPENKKFQIELPHGEFFMIFIANSTNQINAASLDESMSKAEVIEAVLFNMPDKWVTGSDPFIPFPMWGELEDVEVSKNSVMVGGNKNIENIIIPMLRSVVRIDVILEQAVTDNWGKLVSIHLYNRYTQGQVIPDDGTVDFTVNTDPYYKVSAPSLPQGANKTFNPLIYSFNPALNNFTSTIYTFEAEEGSFNDLLNNTCLVLGIDESSSGNPALTWYYRVDFVQNQNGTDKYLPLLRNHNYIITVKDIINHGFPDQGKAFRSQPYGLSYEVTDWDEWRGNYTGGSFRLDISSTLIMVPYTGENVNILITSTHPDGWRQELSISPTSITGGSTISWIKNIATSDLPEQNVPVNLSFDVDAQQINGAERKAYFHIISGNLTNVIEIIQAKYE